MTPAVRLDLHLHSDRSPDSRLSLEEIAARVRAAGLQGFALTDHNTVDGHRPLRALADRHPELILIPGVEVSTADGHLLAYGVDTAPPAHRPLGETIGWVREHGGEPVLAHPFRLFHGAGRSGVEGGDLRALESCNGQSSPRANRSAREAARIRSLGTTGGSDAHVARAVGRAFTVVDPPPASVDDLLEAIRHGRTSGAGESLDAVGQIRWGLRNAALRLGRGLRSV